MVAEGLEFDHNFDITRATGIVGAGATEFKVACKFTRGIDEVAGFNDINGVTRKADKVMKQGVSGFARRIGMQGHQFLRRQEKSHNKPVIVSR